MRPAARGDPTDTEALALEILGILSVTGQEGALALHLERRFRDRPVFGVERVGDSLAIFPHGPREGRRGLLLLGHLDTVPASKENPPRLEDDRLYGLGSSDMKGAVALISALCLRAARETPALDLRAILYAREEGPYEESGLGELLSARPDLLEGVDLALVMEPTENALEAGCLGTLHAWVHVEGRRAHSARPWEGENAIHRVAPLLSALARLEPRRVEIEDLVFYEVLSATMVTFDGARNVVPGLCSVNVNLRYPPDRRPNEAVAYLHSLVQEALPEAWDSGQVRLEITDHCPGGAVVLDHPLLDDLENAAGRRLERRAKQAWTDVGRLSELGLPAVNFGPGSGAQAHQDGEWSSRRLLAEAEATLSRLLWHRTSA